jgi:hydroxymethylpyrimidine pyrophosphatase-like HAD family hydrolase
MSAPVPDRSLDTTIKRDPVPLDTAIRMIAIDMDGTLLGDDGRVSPRNLAALLAAEAAGIEVVVATGRRHSYAMHILRPLGLHHASALVSSNGTVTRTLGSFGAEPIASELIASNHLPLSAALWLCGHVGEFRNALVLTFDRVGPDGEDARGALVVEHLEELNASIGRWMAANEPYIAQVNPIEQALYNSDSDSNAISNPAISIPSAPIQAMLCGTVERMARAEARLLEHPGVRASGHPSGRSGRTMTGASATPKPNTPESGAPHLASEMWDSSHQSPGTPSFPTPTTDLGGPPTTPGGLSPSNSEPDATPILTLHRTEYPNRDLSILDILPRGCSKGAAVLALAASRGIEPAQILAIGDNWNDVSMLEIAGSAVLMANAPEDLKALARTRNWRIGLANTADGVAEAIESALGVTC